MAVNQEPVIKVGILADTVVHFQLNGKYWFNKQLLHSGNYSAEINTNQICTRFGTQDLFELIPENNTSTFTLQKVKIGIGFHWEQEEIQEFEGGLTLQIEDGKIRVVNIIPLESYLKSVISSEMSAMNDLSLLKVHAIVSRSWLLAQLKGLRKEEFLAAPFARNTRSEEETEVIKWYDREDHHTFDVCADDHCQRYQGITKVISKKAEQAVAQTCGQVLTHDQEICDARFSKCCGGISEDFENVWQPVKVPYLVSVRDIDPRMVVNQLRIDDELYYTSSPEAFCNTTDPEILSQVLIDFDQTTTDFYRWKKSFTQAELSPLIHRKSGIDFGEIIDLVPLKRGNSGRIIRLQITGTKRTCVVGKELEIRKWLSESHLYSSSFIVEKVFDNKAEIPSRFILNGAGWGHGVGMCQIGAAVMSREGFSVTQILAHYFSNTQIEVLY